MYQVGEWVYFCIGIINSVLTKRRKYGRILFKQTGIEQQSVRVPAAVRSETEQRLGREEVAIAYTHTESGRRVRGA